MSPDWPWLVVLALVIPPALGHLYHFVLMINVGSGLGLREPVMDKVRGAAFRCARDLVGALALDALAHAVVDMGLAALELRRVVRGLGHADLAGQLAARSSGGGVPRGSTGSSVTLDLAGKPEHDALIGAGRDSWLLRLPRNESFQLQLREWDLAIPNLPERLDGLQIVQISDLHIAPCFERRFFEAVIDACHGWQADLVVMTGDLVEDDETISWVEPLLGPLEARLGKFAILGNHDNEHQPRTIAGELGRAGFETAGRDVDDARPRGHDPGDRRHVGTLGARRLPRATCRRPTSASCLSHSPDLFYKAQRWGIDLMLSGHNHGGPDPVPPRWARLHAQPLLTPIRPRVLPPERDVALCE